jgi:hypothetical protein
MIADGLQTMQKPFSSDKLIDDVLRQRRRLDAMAGPTKKWMLISKSMPSCAQNAALMFFADPPVQSVVKCSRGVTEEGRIRCIFARNLSGDFREFQITCRNDAENV